jgi:nitrite reductase/ring-hydroxylating ferredoxin subunit
MQSQRSFFDPLLIEAQGAAFIRENDIDGALKRLIPKCFISKGSFSYPARAEQRDLSWNHMDQNHRPFIHKTYGEASRIFIGTTAAFSLTRVGRWPVTVPVFDGHFKENGFYQILILFGLVTIVNVIECNRDENGTRMDVSWTIASHRWLRLLHPMLHRRFVRLNVVQNREDDPIRDRRVALRGAGYQFKTNDPDFMNANAIGNNVIFPEISRPESILVKDLPEKQAVRVAVAQRAYLLSRDQDGVDVWPGVCPHEGAELDTKDLRSKLVTCPWHGLKFGGRRLTNGRSVEICGALIEMHDGAISFKAPTPNASV